MNDQTYPMSFAQQRLWTVIQLAENSSAYNMGVAIRLDGELDTAALTRAVEAAVQRHDSLRTGFASGADGPVQRVADEVHFAVELSTAAGLDEAGELLAADAQAPFDLSAPPLMRVRLIRLADGSHILGLCLHHIIADGWSIALLLDDIAAGYRLRVGEIVEEVQAPARTYGEYAIRRRTDLTASRREELARFWASYLDGAPDVLQLNGVRPRPAAQSYAAGTVTGQLAPEDRDRLARLARGESASLYMALLAAYAIVLARNGGQTDIVIGAPVADRGDGDFDGVLGLFLDTQVVRVDVADRPSFRELLARVRVASIDAFVHNDFPFEELVDLLQPERSAAHHPLFQVMLTLQPAGGFAPDFGTLRATELTAPDTEAIPFDLSLSATDGPAGLELSLRYSTDLFDEDAAAALLDQFVVVLRASAEQPDRPVTRLPLMTPGQQAEVRAAGQGDPPPGITGAADCLPARIEAQAARTPDAVAVSDDRGSITYRDLDLGANRIAHLLLGLGVLPETFVGVAARRGTGFITAINGIWRAGAAFVPIDPEQPAERHLDVVRQTTPRVVFVDASGKAALTEALAALDEQSRPLLIDVDPAHHAEYPATPLPCRYEPENLAYAIFTSGTTGRPKGAMVTHDGMINHVLAKNHDVGMTGTDVLAQNGPATFDVVVWQCTASLVLGGRVHVIPDAVTRDPEAFADELARGGVTVLQAVPSVISLLLTLPAPDHRLESLRWMVSTGDALPIDLVLRWAAAYPAIELLNTYGVTECSDDQFHGVVTAEDARSMGAIADIGRPIAGMSGHLLDDELGLTTPNVVGELYLGGLGVGRGYLGRPGLTAERFVPDPYGLPGGRMYRTGDTLRRRADGSLEFLGRADFQLKIRGFRIEPGEVEAALVLHPAIREAVVTAHGPVGPQRQLVAYLVPHDERAPLADVRRFLAARLPEYMVPQHLVWLDGLPVTRHGKLDRAALPAPTADDREAAPGADAPVDELSQVVTGVWREVLGRDGIGAHEGFFHAGGTSLLAVELLRRLREVSGLALTLVDLLQQPTITGIAAVLRRGLRDGREALSTEDIPRRDPSARAPLSYAQERMWLLDQLAEDRALYTVPFVIPLDVAIDDAGFTIAVRQLMVRHESLRTAMNSDGDSRWQAVASEVSAPVSFEDISALSEQAQREHVETVLRAECRAGFDLDQAPLLRLRVFRLGGSRLLAGFVLHHAITDAWSNDILVRDLTELLRAQAGGVEPDLPELPIRYADHSAWQRAELTEPRRAELGGYWVEKLVGAPEMSTFPADRPRPVHQSYRGATVWTTIPAELVRAATDLGRAEGATAFMTLLSAVYTVLSRFSGASDVVIGTTVAGRDHPQTHNLVGCFVNTIPLRLNLPGPRSVRQLVRDVRDVCLSAYAHADLPFDALIERLGARRSVAHHPVFQVLLAFASLRPGETARDVMAADHPRVEKGSARFDLSIDVVEVGDEWRLGLEYATDLFDAATVERIGEAIRQVLAGAAAEPESSVARLPLADANARARIEPWQRGPLLPLPELTLAELVYAQVLRTPDAVALVDADTELTYREFWQRVTALADELRGRMLGADDVVGVCLDRGIDQVVAVHAVLACGAGYLPLDPAAPAARQRVLVDDVGAKVVIAYARTPLVDNVDRVVPQRFENTSELRPPDSVPVDCVAYTIHTSGSTGRPKGVQISHRAAVAYLLAAGSVLELAPGDRLMYKTTFGFDISVTELFWPLTIGATLAVGGPTVHQDPEQLVEFLATHSVGTVQFVPSMLGPFLDHIGRTGRVPAALRDVVTIGEALTPAMTERFAATLPGVCLHNMYGPTEATVAVTWHPLREAAALVPIGRPMPNVVTKILDDEFQPTPIGVPGQLYLGGVQLARAYAGQPGLTAQRFVPDEGGEGERLYATGDLARWLPDGTIDLLGRADHQIKVRGIRIEPAEIEAALLDHEAVTATVVVALEGQLVAYVVPEPDRAVPGPGDLRRFLAQRLPDGLVPSRYVVLAELPRMPNGKINRAGLPAPGRDDAPQTAYVAPADDTERLLASVWADVLGITRVGVHDNFFDLGGDSIMSLLVVSHAARAGVRITPRQFFEHQTVSGLARVATPVRGDGPPHARRPRRARVDAVTAGRVLDLLRANDEPMGDPR